MPRCGNENPQTGRRCRRGTYFSEHGDGKHIWWPEGISQAHAIGTKRAEIWES